MLSHIFRVKRTDIQACKEMISPDVHEQYLKLFQKGKVKMNPGNGCLMMLLKQWMAFNSQLQHLFNCLAKDIIQTEWWVPIKCVLRLELIGQ